MNDLPAALRSRLIADPAVAAIVGERVSWMIVPQGSALPWVRLQMVGGREDWTLSGPTGFYSERIQCDCVAETDTMAMQLGRAVCAALRGPATVDGVNFGHTRCEGPFGDVEDVAGLGPIYRARIDLLMTHTEVTP